MTRRKTKLERMRQRIQAFQKEGRGTVTIRGEDGDEEFLIERNGHGGFDWTKVSEAKPGDAA